MPEGLPTDFPRDLPTDFPRDFQSELPLNPAAAELLATFFAAGWPDPAKLHRQSGQLRNLINTAKESIAANLGIASSELEIVGELGFGFQTAISGVLNEISQSFCFASVDRQVVHAFARLHQSKGGTITELAPDKFGIVDYQSIDAKSETTSQSPVVLSWQSTNRETGVIQQLPDEISYQRLFADMTSAAKLDRLPQRWDVALWDPRSFGGPQGVALLGISNNGGWSNPGPQIDQRRVFGSFSKPLLLATAVALENWQLEAAKNQNQITLLNKTARELIKAKIPNVQIAGNAQDCDPRYLAFSIPGVIAEELLRKCEAEGFLIDAGSACSAGALSPSHVLRSMGLPTDGNIRLTFKPEHTLSDVTKLVERIAAGA